jgi:hypothetical protein
MGRSVPPADLYMQQEIQRARNEEAAILALSQAAYALGCAIGGGVCQPQHSMIVPNTQAVSLPTQHSPQSQGIRTCINDYSCAPGEFCAKSGLSGVCSKSIDRPLIGLPQLGSSGRCFSDVECGLGSRCDERAKACVRR